MASSYRLPCGIFAVYRSNLAAADVSSQVEPRACRRTSTRGQPPVERRSPSTARRPAAQARIEAAPRRRDLADDARARSGDPPARLPARAAQPRRAARRARSTSSARSTRRSNPTQIAELVVERAADLGAGAVLGLVVVGPVGRSCRCSPTRPRARHGPGRLRDRELGDGARRGVRDAPICGTIAACRTDVGRDASSRFR